MVNMKNYKGIVEEIIKEINKEDIHGWKATVTKEYIDLHWNYGVNFRIDMPEESCDLTYIRSACDYGYGFDSENIEGFVFATIGNTRYDDLHGSYDVVIPKFVKIVIGEAKRLF